MLGVVTGTDKPGIRMPTNRPSGLAECPLVPLHSVIMTTTRGEATRVQRDRRGLNREQLAASTRARIERGEVRSSPSIPRLEAYLGIRHGAPEPPPRPNLADVPDLDLVAELARRLAERRTGHPNSHPLGPEGYYRWPTTAAPFPELDRPGNKGGNEAAGGR